MHSIDTVEFDAPRLTKILDIMANPYAAKVFMIFASWRTKMEASQDYVGLIGTASMRRLYRLFYNVFEKARSDLISCTPKEMKEKIKILFNYNKHMFPTETTLRAFTRVVDKSLELERELEYTKTSNALKQGVPEILRPIRNDNRIKSHQMIYRWFSEFESLGWIESKTAESRRFEKTSKKGFKFHVINPTPHTVFRINLARVIVDWVNVQFFIKGRNDPIDKQMVESLLLMFSVEEVRRHYISEFIHYNEFVNIGSFVEKLLFHFFFTAQSYNDVKKDRMTAIGLAHAVYLTRRMDIQKRMVLLSGAFDKIPYDISQKTFILSEAMDVFPTVKDAFDTYQSVTFTQLKWLKSR